MKYFLIPSLIILALALFLPAAGTTTPRNLPLLIACLTLLALWLLCTIVRHVVFLFKVRRLCKQSGMTVTRCRLCLIRGHFHGQFVATHGEHVWNILLLLRRRSYWRYHFEKPARLEFYRSHRVATKVNKITGYRMAGEATTQLVGRQRLSFGNEALMSSANFIIMNKLPSTVSDSASRTELTNGDEICASNTYLYELVSFHEAFDRFVRKP